MNGPLFYNVGRGGARTVLKKGHALVCGDPVIWKPSEKTPLCALACHALALKVAAEMDDVPDGLLSLVVGGADGDRGPKTPEFCWCRIIERPQQVAAQVEQMGLTDVTYLVRERPRGVSMCPDEDVVAVEGQ